MRVHQTASLIAALLLQLAFNHSAAFAASTSSGITVTAIADGTWSSAATWSSGRIPLAGDDVVIPSGRTLTYDVLGSPNLHTLSLYGTLNFSNTVSTVLNIGVLKIGADAKDSSATCNGSEPTAPTQGKLYIGNQVSPIPRGLSATINLVAFSDQSTSDAPGLINCGGRLDLHGAALVKTWTHATTNALVGATTLTVSDDISDWRVGDQIIVAGTQNGKGGFGDNPASYRNGGMNTEARTITAINGRSMTVNSAFAQNHESYQGNYPEVANLTRTVVVRSADTTTMTSRGHTMYHPYSSGSLSYVRFDGLGKEALLGRYPVHLHLAGSTLRGFSAVGNAVTNGGNKFITVHNTDYAVVRDNVGYITNTSGFFLEDGSEVFNLFDGNLAIGALDGKPAPNEALSFLDGGGYGFWWANGRNAFINNASAENDTMGYFFQINNVTRYYNTTYSYAQPLVAPMRQPNGTMANTTINKVPFQRFEHNLCHAEHTWCFEAIGGMWTLNNPSIVKDLKAWSIHYAPTFGSNGLLIDNVKSTNSNYGLSLAYNYDAGWPNTSVRDITVKNTVIDGAGTGGHFQAAGANVNLINYTLKNGGPLAFPYSNGSTQYPSIMTLQNFVPSNITGWPTPGSYFLKGNTSSSSATPPIVFVNDYYGAGQSAKTASTDSIPNDGLVYVSDPTLADPYAVAARTTNYTGYKVPTPIDTLPPATTITSFGAMNDGTSVTISNNSLTVSGSSTDDGTISNVVVNGITATPLVSDYSRWKVTIPNLSAGSYTVVAQATDSIGNQELNPHTITLNLVSGNGQSPLSIATTSIPAATANTAYSTTLQASGGTAPYTWSLSGTVPSGMVFASTGTLSGTPTTVGTFTFTATVKDATQASQSRSYTLSIAQPIAPLSITTASLPAGTQGTVYTTTLAATGGTVPYTWTASGSVPPGLTFSAAGVLSGTPTTAGTFTFTAIVKDATQVSQNRTYTVSITQPVTTPSITTSSLPSATQGVAYTATLTATGGTAPYQWSASGLPSGLVLGASNGVISGTSSVSGNFTVSVTVRDSANRSSTRTLTLQVNPAVITGTSYSLLTGATPTNNNVTDNTSYEMGVKVKSTVNGKISAVRYYKSPSETGSHTGRVWSSSGQLLATVTFTNETASGWQEARLATPLTVTANTTYIVSVNCNRYFAITYNAMGSATTNGPLSSVADGKNMVFGTIGSFPTYSYKSSSYFRDLVFTTTP